MLYVRGSVFVVGLLALAGAGGLSGQEKGSKRDDPAKVKGTLPPGWGKLGLSDEQKQKVYRIQAKYTGEVDELQAKIDALKAKMAKERLDVLTPEQKARLKDQGAAKAGG